MSNVKHHESKFHIAKREDMPMLKAWGIRVIAIVIAILVCAAVIVFLTGYNPLQLFSAMVDGTFGSERKTWMTFQNLSMLLCISLAVTPAFKMKFWNIGAEGQTLVGALVCAGMMIYFGNSFVSCYADCLYAGRYVMGNDSCIFQGEIQYQ